MEECSPVVIDGPNAGKTKIDVSNHKKVVLKRKRVAPLSCLENPEEKQAKIDALREETNSLVRFGKNLVLQNRVPLLENVDKSGSSSAALNRVIACALEESDLPLSKLVDEVFDKVVEKIGNTDSVTKASVKSIVLLIGQRLCYGVTDADADVLENDADCALWCWEIRDLKLMPKSARSSLKVRRTCRKKIQERITAVLAMISLLEKPEARQDHLQEMLKASERLAKVLNEADILSLMENMSQKTGCEMVEKEAKRDEKLLIKQMERSKKEMEKERKKMESQEKLLIKQMERSKKEMEKERKKMDRKLQKEKLQSEKELKRLHDEAEKEERQREKDESEMQKHLKKQQEEAEKNKKRKEREEADLRKQLSVQKQASLMERFLKRNKTDSTPQNDSSTNNTTTSESSSSMMERKSQSATLAMDSVLSQNGGIEEEDIWKLHLNSWCLMRRSTNSNRKVHWGIRQKPKTQVVKELKLTTSKELTCDEDNIEKFVDGWGDSSVSGGLSEINTDNPPVGQKRIRTIKLLQFDKSHRPAFYGVWPRKSQIVGACTPFAKDPDIDYEVDSDEEWEEDEPGESLSDCDKDDEDESLEARVKGDDDDESEDGFFVPDGYLSENEGMYDDEMNSDEYYEEARNVPSSEQPVQCEDFITMLQQQKYLNNLTEHALKKNQPLIISNLMHEKTVLFSGEELTCVEKLERMCLQALSVRPMPGLPSICITSESDAVAKDLETSSNKSSITTPLGTGVALQDADLPQMILSIQSCPYSIGKIVESLHMKFPTARKSLLRNKVREIAEFSDNRWQVKKDTLSKLGLSISPDNKSCEKKTSIATFFSKRCLPPSIKTLNLNETSPASSQKPAPALIRPHNDSRETD
ncbi:LOW QUALITY PROTEIN: chromatin assembly factor 1 subunit FAS1 [Primulina tabacum]|uniref:LOW QUALITY PROTEIN: chromatin assembly factor 1 subunit FAS1 n=1 Tax=Primulina tabacum TaxID=48773 RepID=UPI003F59DAF8